MATRGGCWAIYYVFVQFRSSALQERCLADKKREFRRSFCVRYFIVCGRFVFFNFQRLEYRVQMDSWEKNRSRCIRLNTTNCNGFLLCPWHELRIFKRLLALVLNQPRLLHSISINLTESMAVTYLQQFLFYLHVD